MGSICTLPSKCTSVLKPMSVDHSATSGAGAPPGAALSAESTSTTASPVAPKKNGNSARNTRTSPCMPFLASMPRRSPTTFALLRVSVKLTPGGATARSRSTKS